MTDKSDLIEQCKDIYRQESTLDRVVNATVKACIESDEAREYWAKQFLYAIAPVLANRHYVAAAQAIREKFSE